jgi:hypothetical protein
MELRRKLWEGHLPVKVDLALSDLNNIEAPRSLYVISFLNVILLDNGTKGKLLLFYTLRSEITV